MALGLTGTHMLLQTIISMTLTFIVFTFGSLLVAVRIAGGQLTPRIIAGACNAPPRHQWTGQGCG